MADVRAFRSGNWSDTNLATSPWSNGSAIFAPAAGDVVYSNTFTITIDVSATCSAITNNSASSRVWKDGGTATATAGGSYPLANGVTLTATLNSPNNNLCSLSGTNSAAIVGNINGSALINITTLTNSGSGTLTITGNVVTVAASGSSPCVNNSGTGTISITGNVSGAGQGVQNSSSGIFSITGNVTGGSSTAGATNASTGTFTITGNVTAGAAISGANNSSTGTFTIVGDITATNGGNGFTSSNSAATNRLSGSFISSANGTAAIYAAKYILNTTPLLAKTRYARDGAGAYVDMFTADNSLGQAVPADVRLGTVYASGSLTGTLAVPPVGSVAAGVPVDATVGTATLTASDVRAAMGLASANLDTQLAAIPTDIRTELTPELTEITETHLIHGLKTGSPLNVTPTARTAGAISQTITGDGVTTTTVTR